MSWTELSSSHVMEAGKEYKFTSLWNRTEGESPDSVIEAGLNSVLSNAEIEEKIFRETGAVVKVKNRYAETEVPGKEYSYNVVIDSQETHSPTMIIIGLIIVAGIVAGLWFVVDAIGHTSDKFYEHGMATTANIGTIVALGVVVIIILNMMKK